MNIFIFQILLATIENFEDILTKFLLKLPPCDDKLVFGTNMIWFII